MHRIPKIQAFLFPSSSQVALALFDPLFARATLVVEGDDIFGGPSHVGHDEADTRIKFAR